MREQELPWAWESVLALALVPSLVLPSAQASGSVRALEWESGLVQGTRRLRGE